MAVRMDDMTEVEVAAAVGRKGVVARRTLDERAVDDVVELSLRTCTISARSGQNPYRRSPI